MRIGSTTAPGVRPPLTGALGPLTFTPPPPWQWTDLLSGQHRPRPAPPPGRGRAPRAPPPPPPRPPGGGAGGRAPRAQSPGGPGGGGGEGGGPQTPDRGVSTPVAVVDPI